MTDWVELEAQCDALATKWPEIEEDIRQAGLVITKYNQVVSYWLVLQASRPVMRQFLLKAPGWLISYKSSDQEMHNIGLARVSRVYTIKI